MRRRSLATTAAILLAGAAAAAEPLSDAESRGRALFRHDRAAWLGTDDLRAHLPVERMAETGGWVVTPGWRAPARGFLRQGRRRRSDDLRG